MHIGLSFALVTTVSGLVLLVALVMHRRQRSSERAVHVAHARSCMFLLRAINNLNPATL